MSLLQALDKGIQRAFDACVFFLMRTFGVKKSFIRYVLTALQILAVAGMALVGWNIEQYRSTIVFYGMWIAMMLLRQRVEYRNDLEAEHRGMMSRTDAFDGSRFSQIWKVFFIFLFIWEGLQMAGVLPIPKIAGSPEVVALGIKWAKPRLVMGMLFDLSYLAALYLARTPPTPPPKEVKVPVLAPNAS